MGDPVADLLEGDGDLAGPDALAAVADKGLVRPYELVAVAYGDHPVPAAGLCGSDTGLPVADNLVADTAGDLADFSTQPARI